MNEDRPNSPVHRMIEQFAPVAKYGPVYTVAEASERVGRSINTLKRWHRTGGPQPSLKMTQGKLLVWLYTEDDLQICRQYGLNQRTGPKIGSNRTPRAILQPKRVKIENLGRTPGILDPGARPTAPKAPIRKIRSPNKKIVKRNVTN